jgi:GPH family glycoside/pentoside/hexuronide:cation symporter
MLSHVTVLDLETANRLGFSRVETRRLSIANFVLFCATTMPEGVAILPVYGILPAFYAQYRHVSLIALGAAFAGSRIVDAVFDPLIGHLSDRTKAKYGRRKLWFIAGSLLSAIGVYILFNPSPAAGVWYYTIWSTVVLLGWSMLDLSRNAWGNDLVAEYGPRTNLIGLQIFFRYVGFSAFIFAPLLLHTGKAAVTPAVMSLASLLFVIGMPAFAILAAVFVPNGPVLQKPKIAMRVFFADVMRNFPFWWFVAIAVPSLLAIGANMALGYIFITQYLGLGGSYSLLALPATFAPLLAVPVWLPFARWFQRQGAWAISLGVAAASSAALAFMPPSPGVQLIFFVLLTLFSLASGGNWVGVPMLGDVIDYDELRSGSNKAGFYFAFYTLLNKVSLAIGSGAALLIVGLFGFKSGIPMNATARTGLLIAYAWLPAILNLIAIVPALKFPLTRADQKENQERLVLQRTQA